MDFRNIVGNKKATFRKSHAVYYLWVCMPVNGKKNYWRYIHPLSDGREVAFRVEREGMEGQTGILLWVYYVLFLLLSHAIIKH